ncbi:MAG: hypothetical protein HC889_02745 [Synechococcaceae cyanobacterium SM1_2_3]|nr:hypothetical protein [Synechococcaceae cyanobacterium SM1_2_3]
MNALRQAQGERMERKSWKRWKIALLALLAVAMSGFFWRSCVRPAVSRPPPATICLGKPAPARTAQP